MKANEKGAAASFQRYPGNALVKRPTSRKMNESKMPRASRRNGTSMASVNSRVSMASPFLLIGEDLNFDFSGNCGAGM